MQQQQVFLALGVILVAAAVGFGLYPGVESYSTGNGYVRVPNASPSGAACGLGIAGGLTFVAAALAGRGRGGSGPEKQG